MAEDAGGEPGEVETIRLVFENPPNAGGPGDDRTLRCVALLHSGSVCSKLLRDAKGCQARDDVSCSRRECQHVLCSTCLLKGVVAAAKTGNMYACTQCDHKYYSWDTRSLEDAVVEGLQGAGKRKRGGQEEPPTLGRKSKITKTSWGAHPEAFFRSAQAREFCLKHPPPANPPLGEFVLAITGGTEDGMRTWEGVFPHPELGLGATSETRLHYATLFRILGRQLRASIVAECTDAFPVNCAAAQVDYEHICTSAIEDKTLFGSFLRSLCSGSDTIITKEQFRVDITERKMLLAAWSCGQLLLGRQFHSDRGSRVIGPLQAYMAWGQAIMDRTPFGESLRALGPCPPHALHLSSLLPGRAQLSGPLLAADWCLLFARRSECVPGDGL